MLQRFWNKNMFTLNPNPSRWSEIAKCNKDPSNPRHPSLSWPSLASKHQQSKTPLNLDQKLLSVTDATRLWIFCLYVAAWDGGAEEDGGLARRSCCVSMPKTEVIWFLTITLLQLKSNLGYLSAGLWRSPEVIAFKLNNCVDLQVGQIRYVRVILEIYQGYKMGSQWYKWTVLLTGALPPAMVIRIGCSLIKNCWQTRQWQASY